MPAREEIRASIRDDLIRRLFAVAISVGAAATLAKMKWVTLGRWPDLGEWQQLAILVCAVTATVLSWDGYLLSINQRPLAGRLGFWRFTIDIALVFIYMFLLMTSYHPTWWLTIHAITYSLYAVWDLLSVIQYTRQYYPERIAANLATVRGVYWRGLRATSKESYGPIITLAWGAYFWALVFVNRANLDEHVFVTSLFALAGLVVYRFDKQLRFSMMLRAALVAWLLLLDVVYTSCATQFNDQWVSSLFHL